MKRKVYAKIECADTDERDAITLAMKDRSTRAMVVIVGLLLPLKHYDRETVVQFMQREIDKPKGAA